ncbi:MAG: ribosome maturation factor RimP [Candidatus Bipolaricaulaceae bacterium]
MNEKLNSLLLQGARQAQVELYHWELSRAGPRGRLRVFIDLPQGVGLDDCERASRAIERLLDQANLIPQTYELEVSSPGVERRLWEVPHFRRAAGRRVRVSARLPEGGQQVYEGQLAEADEEQVVLEGAAGRVSIPFASVVRAKVVYEPEREGL